MSKLSHAWLCLTALILMAICHTQAAHWFVSPATEWIVQTGIILVWLLLARLGFAFKLLAWLRPADKREAEAERIFSPMCAQLRHEFGRRWRTRLPWLMVTGNVENVERLVPGLTTEHWQISYRGVFLWCGEPGQIPEADLLWLRQHRGRQALDGVLWLTDATPGVDGHIDNPELDEFHQRTLWQQLRALGRSLSWRPPVYIVAIRDSEHDQFDRPLQSVGICWRPGAAVSVTDELSKLTPELTHNGMQQVSQERRWSWLVELAHDIRHKALEGMTVVLQPLAREQSGVLFSGLFVMPPAQPSQHTGYRSCTVTSVWHELLHQAHSRNGQRDHLIFRDWLVRGVMAFAGVWCCGMLLSAFLNARLVSNDNALLAAVGKPHPVAEQFHLQRELQSRIDTLLWRSSDGVPLQYRFGLSQNNSLLAHLWPHWQKQNQTLVMKPLMDTLTAEIQAYVELSPDSPLRKTAAPQVYDQLKAYLMLTEPQRAEPAFLQKVLTPIWQRPDASLRPGEWMMLSSGMLAFYTRELPQHPQWKQPADPKLIAAARTLLRGQKGLRNSENSLYQQVLLKAGKNHPGLTLTDLLGDTANTGLFSTDEMLPGTFTREAWEKDIRGAIDHAVAGRQIKSDWVLDEAKSTTPVLSEDQLRDHLMARYFNDYAGAWLEFLNSIRWQSASTLSDAIDQLTTLGDVQRSPLPALGKVLRWQAGAGQGGKTMGESLLKSAEHLVMNKQDIASSPANAPADVVKQTFAPLLAILPPEQGQKGEDPQANSTVNGLTLQDYMIQVAQVRLQLQQVTTTADPQAGMLGLMQQTLGHGDSVLATARNRGALLAASLGQDWSGFADATFVEPLNQAWQKVLAPAQDAMNDAWAVRVATGWQNAFSGRYPFASSTGDASLPMLAHYITPQSGVIEQFITQQLGSFLEKQGDEWVPVSSERQAMNIDPTFLNAVNTLSRLGQIAFAQGEPRIAFDIQMRPLQGIEETDLQIDDALMMYFNQQADWQSFTWPDSRTAHPQAVLSYTALNQAGNAALPPAVAFQAKGTWALVRLLENAQAEQMDSSRWRLTWKAPDNRSLSMLLRTQSFAGPLELLKLRNFRLPSQIFTVAQGDANDKP